MYVVCLTQKLVPDARLELVPEQVGADEVLLSPRSPPAKLVPHAFASAASPSQEGAFLAVHKSVPTLAYV